MAARKTPILDARDIVSLVGLLFLTLGAWSAIGMTALILPGLVLTWHALPPRPPFVSGKDR